MLSTSRAARARSVAAVVAVGVALAFLAAGFAAADSQTSLPRPQRILVVDFSTTPADVKLQRGLGSRLAKAVGGPEAAKEKQAAAAAAVTNAIGDTLVAEIRSLGFAAERVAPGAMPAASGAVAIVDGRVLQIDQGNRTARVVVGFGAGSSKVEADAELSYRTADGKATLLVGFEDTGKSRRTPGVGVTMGVGAAAGHLASMALLGGGLHAYSETHSATVAADGTRLAKDLAKQLAKSFAALGWIPPGTMPKR